MIFVCMIVINNRIKFTQGKGHIVKCQGQKYSFKKKISQPIKHKRKVGS